MNEVNFLPIKKFARRELKSHPLLYELLLEEPDKIPVTEFLIKLKIWLKILDNSVEKGGETFYLKKKEEPATGNVTGPKGANNDRGRQ